VILSRDKEQLHELLKEINSYLQIKLQLTVKNNYQVFPVSSRSIDFLGYRFYHSHILLRKSIKQRFARKMAKGLSLPSFAAYWGWAKHSDSNHLIKKLITNKKVHNGH
jgi:RNA-directed DNA polymerase